MSSRWRAKGLRGWLNAALLGTALGVGVPLAAQAEEFSPPARFLPAPEAQPLEGPELTPRPAPTVRELEGPSLGNEWTATARKDSRAVPRGESFGQAAPATLKSTSGNLNWRPRNGLTTRPAAAPPSDLGGPSLSVQAGAWDEPGSSAKSAPGKVTQAVSPLSDPFGDRETASPPAAVKTPSKLELPTFPASKSVLSEPTAAAAEPEHDPAPAPPASVAPKNRGMVRYQPGAAPQARESFLPDDPNDEGPVNNIWEGGNCEKNNKDCASYIKRVQEHQLSKLTKAFLDISPNAPSEERQDVPVSKKSEILAKMEHRVWTNRRGEKVAEGRWVDYVHGRIVVQGPQSAAILLSDLSDADQCLVTLAWSLPQECDPHVGSYNGRSFVPSTFTWTASALCHKPLYFENVQLERYGHTTGPLTEPFASGAHFFVNIAILPYKMGINPPGECQYALGYYRPGSCAPWLLPPFPLSLRGAALQTGAVFGVQAMMP